MWVWPQPLCGSRHCARQQGNPTEEHRPERDLRGQIRASRRGVPGLPARARGHERGDADVERRLPGRSGPASWGVLSRTSTSNVQMLPQFRQASSPVCTAKSGSYSTSMAAWEHVGRSAIAHTLRTLRTSHIGIIPVLLRLAGPPKVRLPLQSCFVLRIGFAARTCEQRARLCRAVANGVVPCTRHSRG